MKQVIILRAKKFPLFLYYYTTESNILDIYIHDLKKAI